MSTEEPQHITDDDATMSTNAPSVSAHGSAPPSGPAAMAPGNRKRPRLDLTVDGAEKEAEATSGRERKRGKSMFGLLLGTLNKAKVEDSERSKSDAAKKRQLTEQRLQDRLRKETDSVRRAEEAKKDKTAANRKEEELQLKDSIYKFRRTRLPFLANFLSTSDDIPPIPSDDPPPPSSTKNPLALPPRAHPPPLYYLPVILTPAQEAFLSRRKVEVKEAVEKEWVTFREERTVGIVEITKLRERVAEEDARKKSDQQQRKESQSEARDQSEPTNGEDVKMGEDEPQLAKTTGAAAANGAGTVNGEKKVAVATSGGKVMEEAGMEVDEESRPAPSSAPKSPDSSGAAATETKPEAKAPVKREAMQTDEDDAVEY